MVWTEKHDEMLCKEIIGVDVFNGTKKGTQKRSAKWSEVVDNLSNVSGMVFKVDNRAVRDRYGLLSMNLRRKLKKEVKESGIAVEMSETERALEAIMEKENASEELRQEGNARKLQNQAERTKAENVRMTATESLGETKKRKSEEDAAGKPEKKKTRSNGSAMVRYLKEKNEKMLELERTKMEMQEKGIEAANQRHEQLMATMQQQHQQQMETFQMMMLQQQQQMQMQQAQQNEMMMKFFGMMSNK